MIFRRLLVLAGCAPILVFAEIDAGGGKSQIGNFSNHASIGSAWVTSALEVNSLTRRSGLIEVLYASHFTADADANGNGIPDEWESEYFPGQAIDPYADSDGDGLTNRDEYTAGTNPTDKRSAFLPKGSLQGTVFSMPMQTVLGRTYQVYATRDLSTWHLRQTIEGDGTVKTFVFDETAITSGPLYSPTPASALFFRVRVTLD